MLQSNYDNIYAVYLDSTFVRAADGNCFKNIQCVNGPCFTFGLLYRGTFGLYYRGKEDVCLFVKILPKGMVNFRLCNRFPWRFNSISCNKRPSGFKVGKRVR